MVLRDHPLAGVRTRRQLKDIKAPALAKRLGVATEYFYKYERGERRLYLDKALALAKMLECTVEELGIEPSIDEQVAIFRQRKTEELSGGPTLDQLVKRLEQSRDTVGEAAGTVVLQSEVNKTIHGDHAHAHRHTDHIDHIDPNNLPSDFEEDFSDGE